MKPDWSDRVLVAVEAAAGRSVGPCLICDAKGLEMESPVALKTGDEVTLQIRAGGARRQRFQIRARVERRDRIPGEDNARVRFAFVDLEPERLVELAALAKERSIFQGKLELPAGAAPPPPPDETPTLAVRPGEELETLLVAFGDPEGRLYGLDQILSGSVFVETPRSLPVNTLVLLRVALAEKRAAWLRGRVSYVTDEAHGVPGMGVALEPTPDAVRRDLQRARQS